MKYQTASTCGAFRTAKCLKQLPPFQGGGAPPGGGDGVVRPLSRAAVLDKNPATRNPQLATGNYFTFLSSQPSLLLVSIR